MTAAKKRLGVWGSLEALLLVLYLIDHSRKLLREKFLLRRHVVDHHRWINVLLAHKIRVLLDWKVKLLDKVF